jgi:hypothetical protein
MGQREASGRVGKKPLQYLAVAEAAFDYAEVAVVGLVLEAVAANLQVKAVERWQDVSNLAEPLVCWEE